MTLYKVEIRTPDGVTKTLYLENEFDYKFVVSTIEKYCESSGVAIGCKMQQIKTLNSFEIVTAVTLTLDGQATAAKLVNEAQQLINKPKKNL